MLFNYRKTYSRTKPVVRVEADMPTTSVEALAPKQGDGCCLDIRWPQPDPAVEAQTLPIEVVKVDNLKGLTGYRIVDIKHVLEWAVDIGKHMGTCKCSQIELKGETKNGLHSIYTFECTMCGKLWKRASEQDGHINKALVWGAVTSGSYYAQVAHMTALMDIPTVSPNKFRSIEKELGSVWQQHLTEEIIKAGAEERAIAIEKGHISPDGVPYIGVYVDGGWLKRSYGHNFNSSSGMVSLTLLYLITCFIFFSL